jgi:hypothetical protein
MEIHSFGVGKVEVQLSDMDIDSFCLLVTLLHTGRRYPTPGRSKGASGESGQKVCPNSIHYLWRKILFLQITLKQKCGRGE